MSDIYNAAKPLLYLSTIFGLAPFTIDDQSKTISSRKLSVAYSLTIFAIYSVISGYTVYVSFDTTSSTFNYIGDYTYLVLLLCGAVVACFTLILANVQRKKIVAMVENFHSIDSNMMKLNVRVPYDRLTRISIGVIAGLILLLAALFTHDFLITRESLGILFWITYFAPIVDTTLMQWQFISFGMLLRRDFNHLNERLTGFGAEEADTISGQKKLMDGGYFESNLIQRLSGNGGLTAWESDFSKFRIRKIAPRNLLITPPLSSLSKVKVIRKIHSNLCVVKELLNSSYSLQLLAIVAQAFIIITTNLYTLFTSGSNVTTHPGASTDGLSFPIIWALFRSLELICITVTCTKISKTANHTAVIVHKLLSRDWEPSIRNQLKLFSIQLLHRKISFSACGFFTLDMTLLHGIIGAATTYLVILIQFHNTYEENP